MILTRDTTTHMQISALEKALDGLTVEDLASREAVRTQILHLAHGTVAAGLQGSGLDEDVTSPRRSFITAVRSARGGSRGGGVEAARSRGRGVVPGRGAGKWRIVDR